MSEATDERLETDSTILLSSLQGAAVTAIQIDGILHEFTTIPGVREDVTDMVLNIKLMALRMEEKDPKNAFNSRGSW